MVCEFEADQALQISVRDQLSDRLVGEKNSSRKFPRPGFDLNASSVTQLGIQAVDSGGEEIVGNFAFTR